MRNKSQKAGGTPYPGKPSKGSVLKEAAPAWDLEEPMIRTQIYLSKSEHDFVQHEAARQGQPMAAVIRAFIDEKMDVPDDAWSNNPLLAPPAPDRSWTGRDDGAVNHDHYIYGTPKKWLRQDDEWAETPPLPEDYYTNPQSRRAYDEKVNRKK